MRNRYNTALLVGLLIGVGLFLTGCGEFWAQPGKTAKEGRRDQIRTMKVNHTEIMQDLNHAFLLDGPSKLNQMSMP